MKRKIYAFMVVSCLICSQALCVFANDQVEEFVGEQTLYSNSVKGEDSSLFVDGDSGQRTENVINLENLDQIIQDVLNNASLSAQEKSARVEKLNMLASKSKFSRGTNKASAKINVSVSTQETGYYCGPATVKQTLTYTNGSAASQSTIAKAIGTTDAGSALGDMVSYINTHLNDSSHVGYETLDDPNVQEIQNAVQYACNIGHPVVCRLKFSKSDDWAYSTNGHYMNANGYKSYGEYIYVTDPNIQRVNPNTDGSYYVHVNSIYYGTHDHFAREMAC